MTLGDLLLQHGFEPVETTTYREVVDKRTGRTKQQKVKNVNWQRNGKLYDGAQALEQVWRSQGIEVDVNPKRLIKAAIANSERRERERAGEVPEREEPEWVEDFIE